MSKTTDIRTSDTGQHQPETVAKVVNSSRYVYFVLLFDLFYLPLSAKRKLGSWWSRIGLYKLYPVGIPDLLAISYMPNLVDPDVIRIASAGASYSAHLLLARVAITATSNSQRILALTNSYQLTSHKPSANLVALTCPFWLFIVYSSRHRAKRTYC